MQLSGDNGIITQAQNATYMQSIAALEEYLQTEYVKYYDDEVVRVRHGMQQFLFDFAEQAHVFRQFFGRGIQVGRRVGLVIVQQAIDKELVGNECAHEVFAEDEKRIVQCRLVHMPLLLLVGREEQHHAVVQFYLAEVQQQKTVCLPKKIKTEEVRLEPLVFGQYGTDVLVRGGIDVEVHAAIRLAERHADQSFGVDYLFHTLVVFAKVIYSFIKMAFIPQF